MAFSLSCLLTAIAKEDWTISRSRSQNRLAAYRSSKEQRTKGLRVNGKSGYSDEYLDKLDAGETRSDASESGGSGSAGEVTADPELRWERLRLSDGDLLSASRDPEFEKLKVTN